MRVSTGGVVFGDDRRASYQANSRSVLLPRVLWFRSKRTIARWHCPFPSAMHAHDKYFSAGASGVVKD